MKLCKNLKGGLQEVADQLELRRVGPQHQAGSDSHLTGMAFFKIKEVSDMLLVKFHFASLFILSLLHVYCSSSRVEATLHHSSEYYLPM